MLAPRCSVAIGAAPKRYAATRWRAAADDAAIWTLLALSLRERDVAAAEAALYKALERDPRSVDAHFHLGNLRRDARRFAEAFLSMSKRSSAPPAMRAFSTIWDLRSKVAVMLRARRRATAMRCGREPQHRQAMGNLAHLLCRMRQYEQALPHCERYLSTFADADATIWLDHGICVLHHLHDEARAEASFRRAVSLAPDDTPSLVNLGSSLIGRGDFAAANEALAHVGGEGPLGLYAFSLLALARQHLCAWDGLDALHARIAERIVRSPAEECWQTRWRHSRCR
jgi:Tfp pilus assembly protein PilF